jgi:hypothetical protein
VGKGSKEERVVRPGSPEDTPPNKEALMLHSGLRKAESSVLVERVQAALGSQGSSISLKASNR